MERDCHDVPGSLSVAFSLIHRGMWAVVEVGQRQLNDGDCGGWTGVGRKSSKGR